MELEASDVVDAMVNPVEGDMTYPEALDRESVGVAEGGVGVVTASEDVVDTDVDVDSPWPIDQRKLTTTFSGGWVLSEVEK